MTLTKTHLANDKGVTPLLADVAWRDTNLTVIAWSRVKILGDEHRALQPLNRQGEKKDHKTHHEEFNQAHRASHQLSVALQAQGLIDEATRFAHRAKCLKRKVLWYELLLSQSIWHDKVKTNPPKHHLLWLFQASWFWARTCLQALLRWGFSYLLFGLAGYGYKLKRCLLWYIGVILLFMTLYHVLEREAFPGLTTALAESVNVFHGRGAAPNITALRDAVLFARLTIVEATMGLLIEVVFVATAIQRLFGK